MKFKESELAHRYLDGLSGLEIGGSAHNSFGLNTRNVDYTDSMDTIFKEAEREICGEAMPVDIVASGDKLPFKDNSEDFIISAHMIEHIFDPIGALKEWYRVVKPGGYIFTIAPIPEQVPGEKRPITTLKELIDRHEGRIKEKSILKGLIDKSKTGGLSERIIDGILYDQKHGHWTVFNLDSFKEICDYLNYQVVETREHDDKVGNGFTVIIQKEEI